MLLCTLTIYAFCSAFNKLSATFADKRKPSEISIEL